MSVDIGAPQQPVRRFRAPDYEAKLLSRWKRADDNDNDKRPRARHMIPSNCACTRIRAFYYTLTYESMIYIFGVIFSYLIFLVYPPNKLKLQFLLMPLF